MTVRIVRTFFPIYSIPYARRFADVHRSAVAREITVDNGNNSSCYPKVGRGDYKREAFRDSHVPAVARSGVMSADIRAVVSGSVEAAMRNGYLHLVRP